MISHRLPLTMACRGTYLGLAIVVAIGPAAVVMAQGFGAQQAVRQQVQGLEEQQVPEIPRDQLPGDRTLLADPAAGKIDTRYVTPGAVALLVLRPAQIMAEPMAELLPIEVATAFAMQHLGIDPADVDEIVAFFEEFNPLAPAYGLTLKLNKPFRGSAIPPESRAHVQLSELAGKRYLQSQVPMLPSFYGVDNRTLIIAPDATLRQIVESDGQPRSGPLIDRVREVPAGSDLYLAVEMASVRPLIQMGLGMAEEHMPVDLQPLQDAPELVAAIELICNLSPPGPTSFIVYANDESAAEQLEAMALEAANDYQPSPAARQATDDDPVRQAMAQYLERIAQPFRPRRQGTSVTYFHVDGQTPAQHQLTSAAVIGVVMAIVPVVQTARQFMEGMESQNGIDSNHNGLEP